MQQKCHNNLACRLIPYSVFFFKLHLTSAFPFVRVRTDSAARVATLGGCGSWPLCAGGGGGNARGLSDVVGCVVEGGAGTTEVGFSILVSPEEGTAFSSLLSLSSGRYTWGPYQTNTEDKEWKEKGFYATLHFPFFFFFLEILWAYFMHQYDDWEYISKS